jgi:hypothetical protein
MCTMIRSWPASLAFAYLPCVYVVLGNQSHQLHIHFDAGQHLRDVPSNGSKLAALLHDAVHVAHHKQELPPLTPVDSIHHILHPRHSLQAGGSSCNESKTPKQAYQALLFVSAALGPHLRSKS